MNDTEIESVSSTQKLRKRLQFTQKFIMYRVFISFRFGVALLK